MSSRETVAKLEVAGDFAKIFRSGWSRGEEVSVPRRLEFRCVGPAGTTVNAVSCSVIDVE